MRAQGKVVQETPMEKHGRIDEGAPVEVEDEFAIGLALRLLRQAQEPRAQGPCCFFVLEDLHLEAC